MKWYDVALWCSWRADVSDDMRRGYLEWPTVVEDVQAVDPWIAVLVLMQRSGLRFVAHAAVRGEGETGIWRWDRVRCQITDDEE